jgi:hypothetical protein
VKNKRKAKKVERKKKLFFCKRGTGVSLVGQMGMGIIIPSDIPTF